MRIEGIPEGCEVVRWGLPKKGEQYLYRDGSIGMAVRDYEKEYCLVIRKLEPVLDVSKIRLKKGWVAQDKNGRTHWSASEPILPKTTTGVEWFCSGGQASRIDTCMEIPWREDVPWNERIAEVGECAGK